MTTALEQPDEPHWTEPGAHPVADGVHRIPLPLPMDGLKAVNVYALETDHGLTLVDAGWALEVSRRQLEQALASIGYRVSDITRFLVTHAHRDHYTQAVAVRREFGTAEVTLGLGERPTLEMFNNGQLFADPTVARLRWAGARDIATSWDELFAGRAPDFNDWALPDVWLDGDQVLDVGHRKLTAVSTPGHTQGHFVFADETAGLLFAGDHVLPTITPSIGFELVFSEQSLGDFLTSLAKVRALPDLRLLPAHGPVTESSHRRVDELVAHHDDRLAGCVAAIGPDGSTAHEVAGRLTWTRHERNLTELDVFNAAMASMETLAHLDLLAARGALTRSAVDGCAVYSRP